MSLNSIPQPLAATGPVLNEGATESVDTKDLYEKLALTRNRDLTPLFAARGLLTDVWEDLQKITDKEERLQLNGAYDTAAAAFWTETIQFGKETNSLDTVTEVSTPSGIIKKILGELQQFPFAEEKTRIEMMRLAQDKLHFLETGEGGEALTKRFTA